MYLAHSNSIHHFFLPVIWGSKIRRLRLCCQVSPLPQRLENDTKPSDSEALVLELWEMWSTPPLRLLPGPLWFKIASTYYGPIYETNRTIRSFTVPETICMCLNKWLILNRTYLELLMLDSSTWTFYWWSNKWLVLYIIISIEYLYLKPFNRVQTNL